MTKRIFTIGHSNRTITYFLDLLAAYQVKVVVDVRTIPHSRHNPQFDQDALKESLSAHKIRYVHLKKLGGLRHPKKESLNVGWHNDSFRGFADYMETEEFAEGLDKLMTLAEKKTCAILCAEAVPWRCHRSLIADALTLKKWHVYHIQSKITAKPHELTSFLRCQGKKLIYP